MGSYIIVAGSSSVAQYNVTGSTWTNLFNVKEIVDQSGGPSYNTSVWGTSSADFWVTVQSTGTDKGCLVHWTGVTSSKVALPGMTAAHIGISSIHGIDCNNIWVGGGSEFIWHYNGSTWEQVNTGVTPGLDDPNMRIHCELSTSVSVVYNNEPATTYKGNSKIWNGKGWITGAPSGFYYGATEAAYGFWKKDLTKPHLGLTLYGYSYGVATASSFDNYTWGGSVKNIDLRDASIYSIIDRGAFKADSLWGNNGNVFLVGAKNSDYRGRIWSIPQYGYTGSLLYENTGSNSKWNCIYGNKDTGEIAAGGRSSYVGFYDGSSWKTLINPYVPDVMGISVVNSSTLTSSMRAFAVAGETIVSAYSNATWSKLFDFSNVTGSSGTDKFTALWGVSTSDLWVCTDAGYLVHWDGTNATKITHDVTYTSEKLCTIHGVASNDIWVGGFTRYIWHYNGSTWTRYDLGITTSFSDMCRICAKTTSDVWFFYRQAGSATAYFYHWDGLSWSIVNTGINLYSAHLYGAWADELSNPMIACTSSATNQIYSGSSTGYSTVWKMIFDSSQLTSGSSKTEFGETINSGSCLWAKDGSLYAVGSSLDSSHNGQVWKCPEYGTDQTLVYHSTGSGTGSACYWNNIYGDKKTGEMVVGGGSSNIAIYSGSAWSTTVNPYSATIKGVTVVISGIAPVPPTPPTPPGPSGSTDPIVNFDGNFITLGTSEIATYSGSMGWIQLFSIGDITGSSTGSSERFTGLWASSINNIWAGTTSGSLINYSGSTITRYTASATTGMSASSIHGLAYNDIWAGGRSRYVWHYNGTTWASSSLPVTGSITGTPRMSMNTPTDVWFFTNETPVSSSNAYHYDGVNWTVKPVGYSIETKGGWSDELSNAITLRTRTSTATTGSVVDLVVKENGTTTWTTIFSESGLTNGGYATQVSASNSGSSCLWGKSNILFLVGNRDDNTGYGRVWACGEAGDFSNMVYESTSSCCWNIIYGNKTSGVMAVGGKSSNVGIYDGTNWNTVTYPYGTKINNIVFPSNEVAPVVCTEADWSYVDGPCKSSNTYTRTWTKSGSCTDGVQHTTEELPCIFDPCSQPDPTFVTIVDPYPDPPVYNYSDLIIAGWDTVALYHPITEWTQLFTINDVPGISTGSWFTGIWGRTKNDLWLGISDGHMAYWDGRVVATYSPSCRSDFDPNTIHGVASNNIWIGGHEKNVWNFNGFNWIKYTLPITPVSGAIYGCTQMCMTSSTAVDFFQFEDTSDGILRTRHFNGTSWSTGSTGRTINPMCGGWSANLSSSMIVADYYGTPAQVYKDPGGTASWTALYTVANLTNGGIKTKIWQDIDLGNISCCWGNKDILYVAGCSQDSHENGRVWSCPGNGSGATILTTDNRDYCSWYRMVGDTKTGFMAASGVGNQFGYYDTNSWKQLTFPYGCISNMVFVSGSTPVPFTCNLPNIDSNFTLNGYYCLPSQLTEQSGRRVFIAPFSYGPNTNHTRLQSVASTGSLA